VAVARVKRATSVTPVAPLTPAGAPQPRRSFLGLAWLGVGFAALGEAAWIVASFLKPRSRAPKGGSNLVVAGPSDGFAPGSVTAFPAGKFYLVRLQDGGFLALHRQCTHLGCSVPWDEASGRFACPCHASVFDLRGDVLAPPAPRPLDLFAVRIENGIVNVDVSAPIRRSGFEPSQVTAG
jgi:cytochrome b6-f complex iron-sulfur subunit